MNSSRAFLGVPGMNQVASSTVTWLEGSTRNSDGDSTNGTLDVDVDSALVINGRVKILSDLKDI